MLGFVAATGTKFHRVLDVVEHYFPLVGSSCAPPQRVDLTDLLTEALDQKAPERPKIDDRIDFLRKLATRARASTGYGDLLARLGVRRVQELEEKVEGSGRGVYLMYSIKRREEVALLRSVYGDHFFLIASHEPAVERLERLATDIARGHGRGKLSEGYRTNALAISAADEGLADEPFGPQVGKTFHLADAFIRVSDHGPQTARDVKRLIRLIFGSLLETPTRDEQAMFLADAAGLRSGYLQRQVGAALVEPETGSPIAVGCNEVPAPGGGQYWTGDEPDERDCARAEDRSEILRDALVHDVFLRLVRDRNQGREWFHESVLPPGTDAEPYEAIAEQLAIEALHEVTGPLSDSLMMSVLEYHRAVHAEEASITDAARRGAAIGGTHLYTTTFPCHLCTKHIVAAGIRRVVYIEPYPRSHAAEMHGDAIVVDPVVDPGTADCERTAFRRRIPFEPFHGIAPRRFRQLFGVLPGERKKLPSDEDARRSGKVPGREVRVRRDRWKRGRLRWEELEGRPTSKDRTRYEAELLVIDGLAELIEQVRDGRGQAVGAGAPPAEAISAAT